MTAKSSVQRSYLWIIPLCMIPGLVVAPILMIAVWYYHPGALELAIVMGVISVAGFAAVATWAALQIRAARRAGRTLEGGVQAYRTSVGLCAVGAILLTIKLAPLAFKVLAP